MFYIQVVSTRVVRRIGISGKFEVAVEFGKLAVAASFQTRKKKLCFYLEFHCFLTGLSYKEGCLSFSGGILLKTVKSVCHRRKNFSDSVG